MRLSVIIVSYNVRAFLEQALGSVRRAMWGIDGEVWVVDNQSSDDSVRMVREKFPEVRLIANAHNPGFAVANNQAIRQSGGAYVLLLNPDTLVEEDTFRKCLDFMDAHPGAGALGVRMIDGSGRFLPESKRGFPSPWVAFCKTAGLSALFPKSRRFNGYYLGHLDENGTHEVEVLAGCFMFIRRAALERAGLLDEAFFMYGEDIDLSYRIIRAGYKNYYFPGARIIHYKGESTKKGSLNYVRTFYQAMIIFTRKHLRGRRAGLFIGMLQAAIWLRAGIALLKNAVRRSWLPLIDAALVYAGLVYLKDFWASYYYKDPHYFKAPVLWFNFPLYTLVWLIAVWLNGGYDRRYDLRRLLRGLALGTVLLAAIYGFLDLEYRPSRALLLLGAAWAALGLTGLRALLHFAEFRNFRIGRERLKNLVIAGSPAESERVLGLLNQAGVATNFIGTSPPRPPKMGESTLMSAYSQEYTPAVNAPKMGGSTSMRDLSEAVSALARGEQDVPSKQTAFAASGQDDQNRAPLLEGGLDEVVRIFGIDEIIFCSKDISAMEIMDWMARLGPSIAYKIVPEGSLSVIGSSSKDEPGELYTTDTRFNIAQPGQRRNKRVLDVGLCLFLLPALPVWLFFSGKRKTLLANWWPVLSGRKTWVGYAHGPENTALPRLKPGVFTTVEGLQDLALPAQTVARLNFLYARDWNVWQDLRVVARRNT